MTHETPAPATLSELAALVGGSLRGGTPDQPIHGVSSVADAGPTDITWVSGRSYLKSLADSRAGAVLISPSLGATPMPAILTADPEDAVRRVLTRFEVAHERPPPGIHPTAIIGAGAELAADVAIGPCARVGAAATIGPRTRIHAGVHLGAACRIGADCELWPNVFVADRCRVGDRVVIKPGAVIGTEGFGFIFREGEHRRVPQIGIVVIEDDVQIGANTCIDRAKFGATIIGRGTKIDNLVQIAHNCKIGPNCIMAGQVALAGSVRLGMGVILAGRAAVIDGMSVGDGAKIAVGSIAFKDIEPGGAYFGTPARPHIEFFRAMAAVQRVPDLIARFEELSKRMSELEAAMHDRKAD